MRLQPYSPILLIVVLLLLLVGCGDGGAPRQPWSDIGMAPGQDAHQGTAKVPPETAWETPPGTTPLEMRFDRETQPFAYSLPHMPAPVPIPGIRAEDCGKCHETIYAEWKSSTHAHALSDLQYQAELAKPDSPRWLCLNCHTPLEAQRAKITVGLVDNDVMRPVERPNPHFDPKLQKEAVTCAVCHLRLGEDGKSYILGPNGSEHAPHPVQKDPERLRSVCLRCHDPTGDAITPNLLCWFTTRQELVEGGGKANDCSSCHMPAKYRILVDSLPDLPIRKAHRHTFPGSGIPKTHSGYDQLHRSGWKSGLAIQAEREGPKVLVTLHNEGGGHSVPTGDPERFVQVRLRAFDAQGGQTWEKLERIGQTWEWNPARKIGDNRIRPDEKRKLEFEPPAAARLVLDILNVRLSKSAARHMAKTTGLDESLLPGANAKVKDIGRLYPFATYIHRQTWAMDAAAAGVIADPRTLVELSRAEREIPIEDRSY